MMYEDEYDYYEPTIVDEILNEYQLKMKNILLQTVKDEIEKIENENIRLKQENEKYKQREREIANKERDLKCKEENLKSEVTNEFYKSNIGDTLKQYIEDSEVWFADIKQYLGEKCNLCNEERKLIAEFPNGKSTKINCDCAKTSSKYIPVLSTIEMIRFDKRDSRYSSDRRYYLSRTYSPSNKNDYDYQEFKIYHVVNEFNENIIELHKNKSYGENLGFKNKEDCQKYCDWLNNK